MNSLTLDSWWLNKKLINVTEILNKVCVYKGVIPETQILRNLLNNSIEESDGKFIYEAWRPWFEFGKITSISPLGKLSYKDSVESLCTSETDQQRLIQESFLHEHLAVAAHTAINAYVKQYDVPLPVSSFVADAAPAYYEPGFMVHESGMAMNFHSDFAIPEWWWPGEKFLLTCTIYLNDDYEGGEIVFLHKNKIVEYKPQAGDIIVFPSGNPLWPTNDPYFHAVKTVKESKKLLVRGYVKYKTANNQLLWDQCVKMYGAEKWREIALAHFKEAGHPSVPEVEILVNEGKWVGHDLISSLYSTFGR